jgi:effector-binding domain-containing protein
MKKLLKFLLYLVGGLAILLVSLGIFAKKEYRIERSIDINAPQSEVYQQVQFFKNTLDWSPWMKLDPNVKSSITGTDGSVGSVYAWEGNSDVGKGKQTITALAPERIEWRLDFEEPMSSTSPVYMDVKPVGNKTKVVWGFDFKPTFPWNGLMMFTDVDKAIGTDYEKGLASLKQVCEAAANQLYNGYQITVEDQIPVAYYLGTRQTVPMMQVPQFLGTHLPSAVVEATKAKATLAGHPSGLYWTWDTIKGTTDMAAAIPLSTQIEAPKGKSIFPVGGGKALVVKYLGAYDQTVKAHMALDAYVAAKGLQVIEPVIEEYVTDPGTEPDTAKWLTKVIYFVEPKK